MKLSELGEREAIKRISVFLDIGDDAACIPYKDEYLVVCTDMIYKKTHIPDCMSMGQIGAFVASVNASDIASMGARPEAFLMSCGLPDLEYSDYESIIRGAQAKCEEYGMRFAGGDTKQSDELTLAGFCLGTVKTPVYRSGARVGDLLAVTGCLGDAALGFEMIAGDIRHPLRNLLVERAIEPRACVREGVILGEYATSMTDISDGLAVSVHDLASCGDVGILLDLGSLPSSGEARGVCGDLDLDILDYALYGGGDYGLLFTIPEEHAGRLRERMDYTVIGRVRAGDDVLLNDSGCVKKLEKRGFEHFKGPESK